MNDTPIRRGWRAIPRGLRWLLITIPALFLTLILGCNLALWTGAIEALATGSHTMSHVRLQFGHAWMLWPGKVHIRDFHLDLDSHFYQLHVDIPSGEANIDLFALASRRFRTRAVKGEGAKIWVVVKSSDPERAQSADIPQIANYGRPVRADQPPEPPPKDQAWTIEIDGIEGEIEELRVDEIVSSFHRGHLSGSVYAVPGHAFAVDEASFDATITSVEVSEQTVLASTELELELELDEYNPFAQGGPSVVKKISAELSAHATIEDLAPIGTFLPDAASFVALDGGAGPLELELALDAGALQTGSTLSYDSEALRVSAGEVVVGAPVGLRASVDQTDDGAMARATLRLDGLHAGIVGEDEAAVEAEQVELRAALIRGDAMDWALHNLVLSIPSLTIERLAALDGLSDALSLQDGSAELSLQTSRERDGSFATDASVTLSDGALAVGSTKLRSSAELELLARTQADLSKTTISELNLGLDGLALRTSRGSNDATWVRINGGELGISHGDGPITIDGQLHGRLEDLRVVLAQTRSPALEDLPELDITEPIDFALGIQRNAGGLSLDIGKLSRPGLNIRGAVHRGGDTTRYAILLELAHIGVHGAAGGEPKVDLAVGDDWLANKRAWVEGGS